MMSRRLAMALAMLVPVFVASSGALACVVGTGTGASCTESALNACLPRGVSFNGTVTFNCGGAATITATSTKTISADTTIDGGSLITISGGHSVGVFSVSSGVKFTVQNLTIANGNSASGSGGGVSNNGGTLTVTNSTFSGNSADFGGAIDTVGGTVTNSTFSGNSASGSEFVNGKGGAIRNGGPLTVTNSTFSGNSASGSGGGIANQGSYGGLRVTNSTFSGNSAVSYGGGIYNNSSSAVTNSTFSGNTTNYQGGGFYNDSGGWLTVTNSTFSGNSASRNYGGGAGGAIFNAYVLTVTNTIVSNSTLSGNCYGPITDRGHNLDSDGTCRVGPASDPMLAPGLATNGGPTQTIALQAGSPAINAGDESVCAAPPVNNRDQRGYARPGTGSANCSIGAYEYYSLPPCCQCPASCAAPSINGSCGDCIPVAGATCESGDLCVLHAPTSTPTVTPTPTITHTPTRTPTVPTQTPTPTATKTPGANDCCQCADLCAAPIVGTCGGCAVVFAASCAGGVQCISRTPTTTPCVGDCNGSDTVTVDEILTMVNIALGNTPVTTCEAGDANHDGEITVDEILTAVNNALIGCPEH